VLDGAVACFDGVAGSSRSRKPSGRQADKYGVPADVLHQQARPHRRQLQVLRPVDHRPPRRQAGGALHPIGLEADLKGLVDLVENRAIIWKDESLGAEFFYEESRPTWPTRPRSIAPS
jgi:elongation factor G